MGDCIFCKIIKGEIPCAKIYEDSHTFAMLDIAPVHEGHALVMSKKHCETIDTCDEETVKQVALALKKVVKAVKEGVHAAGVNVVQNNYPASGQLVPHLHFHVIPRGK